MRNETLTNHAIEAVEKSIVVPWPVEAAFRRFTDGIGEWWPLATHSIGEKDAATCVFEGREGGRIYEVHGNGREAEWGTVTAWEPPRRLAFTWHPGREPDTAQEVEVTFREESAGTRVDLVHRGWERLGDRARETRENYDSGWDLVLGRYIEA